MDLLNDKSLPGSAQLRVAVQLFPPDAQQSVEQTRIPQKDFGRFDLTLFD